MMAPASKGRATDPLGHTRLDSVSAYTAPPSTMAYPT